MRRNTRGTTKTKRINNKRKSVDKRQPQEYFRENFMIACIQAVTTAITQAHEMEADKKATPSLTKRTSTHEYRLQRYHGNDTELKPSTGCAHPKIRLRTLPKQKADPNKPRNDIHHNEICQRGTHNVKQKATTKHRTLLDATFNMKELHQLHMSTKGTAIKCNTSAKKPKHATPEPNQQYDIAVIEGDTNEQSQRLNIGNAQRLSRKFIEAYKTTEKLAKITKRSPKQ